MLDKYYSVKDVSELFNVEEQIVMQWILDDKLTAVNLGGNIVRIGENELLNFFYVSHYWRTWSNEHLDV
ncbi:hypothetical protein BBG47_26690 [Paenibacillus sp. KS1]|nr:hypothetical protein BBG47_26690 [Paenibacillus sp. KS1]